MLLLLKLLLILVLLLLKLRTNTADSDTTTTIIESTTDPSTTTTTTSTTVTTTTTTFTTVTTTVQVLLLLSRVLQYSVSFSWSNESLAPPAVTDIVTSFPCLLTFCSLLVSSPLSVEEVNDTQLVCQTGSSNQTGGVTVRVLFGKAERTVPSVPFRYLNDPVIIDASPGESFYA